MDRRTTRKRIWSLLLTLTMVLTMSVTALPAYAAGGSISVTFDPNVTGLTETTFNVYKVGHFDRYKEGDSIPEGSKVGDAYLVLDKQVSGVSQDIFKIASPESDWTAEQIQAWEDAWLDAASTLKPYADQFPKVNESPVTAAAGSTTELADATDNGVYLIVGDEKKVGDEYWCPVPVLTLVLNGNSTYTFDSAHVNSKMTSKPVVYKHNVKKVWNDNNNEKGVRPEELKVEIKYGGQKIDTVTLNEGNNWNYTWYSQETRNRIYTSKNPEDPDSKGVETEVLNKDNDYKIDLPDKTGTWEAVEVFSTDNRLLYNYYIQEPPKTKITVDGKEYTVGTETTEDNVSEFITLANTFDVYNLEIEKTLQSYATAGADMNTSFVFEVTGYANDASGKEIVMYHTFTGLVFDKPGSDKVTLENIPVHLTRLVVEEKDSANYEAVGDKKVEFTTAPQGEDKTYKASFSNKHPDSTTVTYTGSVVNMYSKGDDGTYTYTGKRVLAGLAR